MKHEQHFDHAITLAAAFVANGDIRLPKGSTRATSEAMVMTRDLIETLYEEIAKLDAELAPEPDPEH